MFKNRPYLKPTDDRRCVVYFQLCLQVSSSLPKTSYFKLVDVCGCSSASSPHSSSSSSTSSSTSHSTTKGRRIAPLRRRSRLAPSHFDLWHFGATRTWHLSCLLPLLQAWHLRHAEYPRRFPQKLGGSRRCQCQI